MWKLGAFESIAAISATNPLLLHNVGDKFTADFISRVYIGSGWRTLLAKRIGWVQHSISVPAASENLIMPLPACQNLILVAGHAPFKESTEAVPEHPEKDDAWVLQPFQRGEPPLYIDHIHRGVALLAEDANALLVFSGGYTRKEAGLRWSEAATYAALAGHFNWWVEDDNGDRLRNLSSRAVTEDFSRDSFENLLFGICRFQQVTGHYPGSVTVISWAFKQPRFDLHRAAIRFPAARFRFEGCNDPLDREPALRNEAATLQDFMDNRYGSSRKLAEKRASRNPFNRQHGFHNCPGLRNFFQFIDAPHNGQRDFPERLPWED